ncbi:Sulfite exporter TauE/SafE [Caloramator mitchellensis]|uniref:Probable membrane transporter protein n=1 Tax=Caloramator mitchellensis TaxID=908809 RepID=A0A0R3K1U8_CALMK|nr:sulfite exporter TauE/SafE family protein [Caloramator mitchellensis]KRQ87502.1 Sulfite exporter TauE/SafE [Caloramator mitchellensis]
MKDKIKLYLIGFITGIFNGLFGSGGGTVLVPSMTHFLKTEQHKAHATAIAVILPLSIISSLLYVNKGYVDWNLTLKVVIANMIGGYIGSKILNKFTDGTLKLIFGIFMIAAAIRMVFFK